MGQFTGFSVDKKVLIFLSKFDQFSDSWEVPFAISQEGLAERLNLQISNLSRTLAPLITQNLIESRLAHVQGVTRRRKVYFLTDVGKNEATQLKTKLEKIRIRVKDLDGKLKELSIDKVFSLISAKVNIKPELVDLIDFMRTHEVLELELFIQHQKKLSTKKSEYLPEHLGKKTIQYINQAPEVQEFINRDHELAILKEIIDSEEKRIIVIQGIAGIGKSTLVAKLINEYKDDKNLFWYSFHTWDSISDIVIAVGEFLSLAGRKKLSNTFSTMKRAAKIEPNKLLNILYEELAFMNMIIVFDNVERINSLVIPFFSLLIERWDSYGNNNMIFLTREFGRFYNRKDSEIKKRIFEQKLSGLDKENSFKFIGQSFNGTEEELWELTLGHPMMLEFIREQERFQKSINGFECDTTTYGDINSFIEHEIISNLRQSEKTILEYLAIYRHPVSLQIVLEQDQGYELIDSLVRKGLVIKTMQNLVEVHDLIKNIVLTHMPLERLKGLHKKAYDKYIETEGIKGRAGLEALYHLQESGDWDDASNLAYDNIELLITMGEAEIKELLSNFRKDRLKPENLSKWLMVCGELYKVLEAWPEALQSFNDCLELREEDGAEAEELAVLHNKIGEIQKNIDKWDETITSHKKALKLYETAGNRNGQALEYLALGRVYKNLKKFTESQEMIQKSRKIFSSLKDKIGLAAAENNLGMLLHTRGKLTKAKEHLEKSFELGRSEEDWHSMAVASENLGNLARTQGRTEKVISYYKKAITWFEKTGNVQEMQRLVIKLGDYYYSQDELLDAYETVSRGFAIGDKARHQVKRGVFFWTHSDTTVIDNPKIRLRLHQRAANICRELKNEKKCISHRQSAIDLAKKYSRPKLQARMLVDHAIDFETFGHYKAALKSLEDAFEIVTRSRDSKGQIAILLNISRINISIGKEKTGIKFANQAFEIAERIKDKAGAEQAYNTVYEINKRNKKYTKLVKQMQNQL